MSADTYNQPEASIWANQYGDIDYERIGCALLQLQLRPPDSLRDYEELRSMPPIDHRLSRLLETPIDNLVLRTNGNREDAMLTTANAVLDWNGKSPYFRTRHVFAMGIEGLESIRGVSPSRAFKLGTLVTNVCQLTVPDRPCPELSAYVCQDLKDVPAYAVTKPGRAVVFARKSMADAVHEGLRGSMLLEGLNSMSQGRTENEIRYFESRFWLAKALFRATNPNSGYYTELGGMDIMDE